MKTKPRQQYSSSKDVLIVRWQDRVWWENKTEKYARWHTFFLLARSLGSRSTLFSSLLLLFSLLTKKVNIIIIVLISSWGLRLLENALQWLNWVTRYWTTWLITLENNNNSNQRSAQTMWAYKTTNNFQPKNHKELAQHLNSHIVFSQNRSQEIIPQQHQELRLKDLLMTQPWHLGPLQ